MLDPEKLEEWASFVSNHPYGNIFQTPLMHDVYDKSQNHNPILIFSEDNKGEINGVLLAVIERNGSGLKGYLTRRSIIFGGPLVKDNSPSVLKYLLIEYSKKIKGRAIYSQIRNNNDWGILKKTFIEHEFKYSDHLDIVHNLEDETDRLWNKLDYSKKKNIKSAQKKGIIIKKVNLNLQLEEVYNILKSVYKRAKIPLFDYQFFQSSNIILKDHLVCLGAYLEDKLIGIRLVLCYNKLIYDWYGGSLEDCLQYRPNDILPWEVMKWAKSQDYRYFDFGGAGKPDTPYGVREFKLKFGGELKNYGRFELIHKPCLMKFGKIGLHFYRGYYDILFSFKR